MTQKTKHVGPDFLRTVTVKRAASLLQVHPNTIRRWIEQGFLRASRLQKEWRIPEEEVVRVGRGQ